MHRAERGQEQEDHDHDDQHGLDQRVLHLVDRGLNELGGIVGHLHLHRRRQVAFQLRKQRAHALDQRQRVALRGRLHADEDRALAAERDARIRALGGEFDGRDILDPHEAAVLGLDDHLLELIEVPQVRIGLNVRDDEVALGLAGRGLEVVGGNRRRDVVWRHAAARHPHRIEPQPHRKRLAAENVGRRHAVDRRQHRLHHARQIIRDRRARELVAGEAEIHHGRGLAGRLGHDRVVRFLRDQVFDRVRLGENFGQRLVRVEIQLDVDLDRAGALHRRRRDVVDTLGGSDRLLDRRGDEALNQVGRRTRIDGGDVDHRVRQLRILPDRQYAGGPQTDQEDQQADDDRQDRTLDENIG